jgi:hypothetical protein
MALDNVNNSTGVSNASTEYEFVIIEGVKCIAWRWQSGHNLTGKEAKEESKRRQAIKNEIGMKYPDMPLLDSKQCQTGTEYCDIIIYSNDSELWYVDCKKYFASQELYEKMISGGHQLVVFSNSTLFITINVYPKTKKIMIQPGDCKESHLITFLTYFPNIRSSSAHKETAMSITAPNLHEETAKTIIASNLHEDTAETFTASSLHEKTAETITASSPHEETGETITGISAKPAAQMLRVKLPPMSATVSVSTGLENPGLASVGTQMDHMLNTVASQTMLWTTSSYTQTEDGSIKSSTVPEGFMTTLVPIPPMPLGRQFRKKTFIVNEVLCYIQNKMDTLPTETIVKLGSGFFKYTDIKYAKEILFKTTPLEGQRLKVYRGENKAKQDMSDMIMHFHMVPLMDIPVFLAGDISLLPPLSGDSKDSAAILRDLEAMQTQLTMLTESQKVMSELLVSHITEGGSPQMAKEMLQVDSQSKDSQDISLPCKPPLNCVPSMPLDKINNHNRLASALSPKGGKKLKKPKICDNLYVKLPAKTSLLTDAGPSARPTQLPTASQSPVNMHVQLPVKTSSITDAVPPAWTTQLPITSQSSDELPHPENSVERHHSDYDSSDTDSSLSNNSSITDVVSDNTYAQVVTNAATRKAPPVRSRIYQNTDKRKRYSQYDLQVSHTSPHSKGNSNTRDQQKTRQHKNSPIQGSSTAPGLRTINNQRPDTYSSANKSCTGVFITRFTSHTSPANIETYVRHEAGLSVKAEKLPTKYNSYSSFYIPCSGQIRTKLLDGSIWPRRSLIKPFYS